jgi:hypothetical protein
VGDLFFFYLLLSIWKRKKEEEENTSLFLSSVFHRKLSLTLREPWNRKIYKVPMPDAEHDANTIRGDSNGRHFS